MNNMFSKETLNMYKQSEMGIWGKTLSDIKLDASDIKDYENLSQQMQYAQCILKIAKEAPIRIFEGELIVGSASIRQAAFHTLPIFYNEKPAFPSFSHVTLGFDKLIKVGYEGIRAEIEQRMAIGGDEKAADIWNAMLICLDAANIWHDRYLEKLMELRESDAAYYDGIINSLKNVPNKPPTTFREAIQSLWMAFSFQRLCGNWPGIGRIDEMLGSFLDNDLEKGIITLEEARELIAHFWIKGCEWRGSTDVVGSGDGQFYQNIILSGINEDGEDVTNHVTNLILDVVGVFYIPDYPIAVRVNEYTTDELLEKVAIVQQKGAGVAAVYNEAGIIDSLVKFGYDLKDARRFANDGCWEIQIPGETCFTYMPFDLLPFLQNAIIGEHEDFEHLYKSYESELLKGMENMYNITKTFAKGGHPATLASILTRGCIEKGRDYYDRGARFTVLSPHAGGIADTANSLLAIKKLVYEQKKLSLKELAQNLENDWEGQEELRLYIKNNIIFYGNNNEEADMMAARVLKSFTDICENNKERNGVLLPAGVSTFGRQLDWRVHRKAMASGQKKGSILAPNLSPTPGTDLNGPTSIIKSHCALGLSALVGGTALDLQIYSGSVEGHAGIKALAALDRVFVNLGGIFMHIDVADTDTLLDAQINPDKHQSLAVRVSGWSARFVTLNEEWQQMIINRSMHTV